MPHDFIPERDLAFLDWSRNFKNQTAALHADIGLTEAQASEYATLHDAYAAALTLAKSTATNTTVNRVRKNTAKKAVKSYARVLARIIRATPGVSDGQRVRLGLTVPDTDLTPAVPPASKPFLEILSNGARLVKLRIRENTTPTRRAKPEGVAGATVFTWVGESSSPPSLLREWTFRGNATRSIWHFNLDASIPAGAKVWITACWYNTRGRPGQMSSPIFMRAPDGVSKAA